MPIVSPSPMRSLRGKIMGGAVSRVVTIHAAENAMRVSNGRFNIRGLRWSRLHTIPKRPRFATEKNLERYIETLVGPVIRVGEGKSGTTFKLKVTPVVLRRLRHAFLETLSHTIVQKLPIVGSMVLFKVVDLRKNGGSLEEAIEHYKRETEAHLHLSIHPPFMVGINGSCSHLVYPSRHVPCLYAFGIDLDHGVAVTCMQYIRGTPISKIPITAKVFMETEKAMCALWASGVDHNDSHFENIIVTPAKKVYFIDFEFATRIPKAQQRQFISFLDMPGGVTSLNSAAQVFFARHSNAIQFQRTHGKILFYNPGYKALRVLWNRMSPREQARVVKTHGEKSVSCAMAKLR